MRSAAAIRASTSGHEAARERPRGVFIFSLKQGFEPSGRQPISSAWLMIRDMARKSATDMCSPLAR